MSCPPRRANPPVDPCRARSARSAALTTLLALALPACAAAMTTTPAELPGLLVDRWTTDDGLRLDHVTALAQTPDGFVWVASFDGLSRFDGQRFVAHNRVSHPGLPSNRILDLEVAADGALWLVTEPGQLAVLEGGRFRAWQPGDGLPGEARRLLRRDGELWVACGDGVARIEAGRPVAWAPAQGTGRVEGIAWGEGGVTWVASWGRGLLRIDGDGAVTAVALPPGPVGERCRSVHVDGQGRVWLGTDRRVLVDDGGGLTEVPFAGAEGPAPVLGLASTAHGELTARTATRWWVLDGDRLVPITPRATILGPLTAADGATWRGAGDDLYRDERVALRVGHPTRALLAARDGALWVGTDGGGLLQLRRSRIETVGEAQGLPPLPATVVAAGPEGAVWIGGPALGLVHWDGAIARPADGAVGTWTPTQTAPTLFSLLLDPTGRLWLGRGDGVVSLDGERVVPAGGGDGAVDPRTRGARALHLDAAGRLWAGTDLGLWRRLAVADGGVWEQVFSADGATVSGVRAFADAPDGSLWMGTRADGVLRLRDGAFETLTEADGLASDIVRDVFVDPDGVTWVATEDRGLCRVAPADAGRGPLAGASVACLDSRGGLFDDAIHSVTLDAQDRLWVSSNRGIFWVRRADVEAFATGEASAVVSLGLTEHDGLVDAEANGGFQPAVSRDPRGRLWYPTQGGAACVDPAAIPLPTDLAVVIDGLEVDGVAVETGGTAVVALAPGQRDIAVRWTTPEFTWPDQLRFRYRLRGYDARWRGPTTERSATWTNVPAGEHVVEVVAGLGGVWSGTPATWRFTRRPALRESPWMALPIALAGALLAGLAGVLRRYRQRGRQRELEALVDERTAALEEARRQLAARDAALRRVVSGDPSSDPDDG